MLRINSKNIWHDRDSKPKLTACEPRFSMFFAHLQKFWSTFANGLKRNYCFVISSKRVLTNINSITDFYTLCKRVSLFSDEKFLSRSAKKFCRGTILCFTNFLVSKKFMDKRGGEGVSRFPVKTFCLTVPKNFVGNPSVCHYFRVLKDFRLQRVMSRFCVENFVSQCR